MELRMEVAAEHFKGTAQVEQFNTAEDHGSAEQRGKATSTFCLNRTGQQRSIETGHIE